MRRSISILVMLVVSFVVSAEEPPSSLVSDPRVEDAVAAWAVWVENDLGVSGVPAASYAFVHGDEVLASGGIGLADPAIGKKADADTLYSICSISKLFTSIAVMQLRDGGKLRLDDDLSVYLPWFATMTDAHPDDESISIRNVLSHAAGLPRESDSPYWSGPDFDFPTSEEIRERLPSQQSLYPSGRYFQYSNLGMSLLGEVIAASAGRPWADVVRDDILVPLDMNSTFTSVPEAHATGRLAAGYSNRRGSPGRERLGLFDVEGIGPAAGMASSASDLAKFARWQLRLRADGGDQVLRASTLREMQRVHWVDPDWDTTWGLGFNVTKRGQSTWARHGGACPGFYTEFGILLKEELGVVVLTNAIGSDVSLYGRKAAALLGPAVKAAVKGSDEQPALDPELEPFVGTYDSVWGREAIVRWNDGLAVVSLRSRAVDPDDWILPLKHIEGNVFRRVRKDDKSLGEEWVFTTDADGQVVSVTAHSNPAIRVLPVESNDEPSPTIVFVHGAWGGGWQFHKVEPLIEKAGYRVFRPTMTGLGERVHLAGPEVGLSTHIDDIVNVLRFEDLHDVVLVGHSYGGMVIAGVADRVPHRIAKLVFMDAILPEDGESVTGLFGDAIDTMAAAGADGAPPWQLVPLWVEPGKQPPVDVPQPLLTFTEPISLENQEANEIPGTFLLTVKPGMGTDSFDSFADRARARGWEVVEMAGGHNPQWFQPEAFVDVLLGIVESVNNAENR